MGWILPHSIPPSRKNNTLFTWEDSLGTLVRLETGLFLHARDRCHAFVLILNCHNPKFYECSVECVLIGYDLKSKLYCCYNCESKQVYSSYHVRFLESYHSSPSRAVLPSPPASLSSITTPPIFQPLSTNPDNSLPSLPVHVPDDLPAPPSLINKSIPNLDSDNAPEPDTSPEPANIPQTFPPIFSTRQSTQLQNRVSKIQTCLERAIQESQDSATCLKLHKNERQKALQDLHISARSHSNTTMENTIPDLQAAFVALQLTTSDSNYAYEETALAAINATDIGPTCLGSIDEPSSWDEVQRTVDADKWANGYREKLLLLKKMGMYELVWRSDVPTGHKVCKGWPVFLIKCDKHGTTIHWKSA